MQLQGGSIYIAKVGPFLIGGSKDPKKLEEMLKHSGGAREVPVIVEGGKTVVGYGGS